jgi:hypothetical protein
LSAIWCVVGHWKVILTKCSITHIANVVKCFNDWCLHDVSGVIKCYYCWRCSMSIFWLCMRQFLA